MQSPSDRDRCLPAPSHRGDCRGSWPCETVRASSSGRNGESEGWGAPNGREGSPNPGVWARQGAWRPLLTSTGAGNLEAAPNQHWQTPSASSHVQTHASAPATPQAHSHPCVNVSPSPPQASHSPLPGHRRCPHPPLGQPMRLGSRSRWLEPEPQSAGARDPEYIVERDSKGAPWHTEAGTSHVWQSCAQALPILLPDRQ